MNDAIDVATELAHEEIARGDYTEFESVEALLKDLHDQ